MSNSENNHPHDTQGINTLKRDSVIRLVDDDPSVLRALTTFLQMDDWQVRCFKSGIDFLHTPGKEPGCVIQALSVKITFATLSVLHGVVKHAIFAGVYR